jgi:hypothetical protein
VFTVLLAVLLPVYFAVRGRHAAELPPVCASVPGELIDRLVPQPVPQLGPEKTDQRSCVWRSAAPAPISFLRLQLSRAGTANYRGQPAEDAQRRFVRDKTADLGTGAADTVFDLAELGSSAYVVFAPVPVSRGAAVFLHILRGPDILVVEYRATPSTRELTLGAAVAVARTVLAGTA